MFKWTHKYVNFFVTPLKRWFPRPVTFWRPDNNDGLFAKRVKPMGYWLGHAVAYATLAGAAYFIYWLITCIRSSSA